MKILVTATALLILLASANGMAQISPAEFTEKFVHRVEQSHPEVKIVVSEPLELTATGPSGQEVAAFLGNAYELYKEDLDQLDEILARYVASLIETLVREDEPASISNIVPVVKDSAWLAEAVGAAFEDRDTEPPDYLVLPLASGLSIIYAEDTPTNIRYIEKATLAEMGVDVAAIPERAVDNLLAKLPEISVEGGDGLYMLIADGTYEASLLLVDEIWTPENFAVDGEIVVALPARDVLLVSGTNDADQFERLVAFSEQIYTESPYYLTRNLYVRRNGRWELYQRARN